MLHFLRFLIDGVRGIRLLLLLLLLAVDLDLDLVVDVVVLPLLYGLVNDGGDGKW